MAILTFNNYPGKNATLENFSVFDGGGCAKNPVKSTNRMYHMITKQNQLNFLFFY